MPARCRAPCMAQCWLYPRPKARGPLCQNLRTSSMLSIQVLEPALLTSLGLVPRRLCERKPSSSWMICLNNKCPPWHTELLAFQSFPRLLLHKYPKHTALHHVSKLSCSLCGILGSEHPSRHLCLSYRSRLWLCWPAHFCGFSPSC